MVSICRRLLAASALLLTIFVLQSASRIDAQAVSIASVTGRVTDPSGAIVVGAQLKMTDLDTDTVHSTTTGPDGLYSFPSLPIGPYTLDLSAQGFETYEQKGLK